MTDPVIRLAAAEQEAEAARARMNGTVALLQERLEPKRLAREARGGLIDARDAAVERAGDIARRRPGALAGAVAAAGLFLGRHRIARLLRRRRTKATSDATDR